MEDLTEDVTLPVLQDTSYDGVAESYGTEKWYFTIIDRDGKIRYVHYELDLDDDEEERFLDEIAELVGESS